MTALRPDVEEVLDDLRDDGIPQLSSLSVAGARDLQDELFEPPEDPVDVGRVTEYAIPVSGDDIPIRIYEPDGRGPFPALVYFHGGGWVLGDLDGVDQLCRLIANEAGCAVVSVDYRLAPEHPFPTPVEDCYAAVEWLAAHPEAAHADADRIAVGGDSAGGNLAAAVALLARDRGGPDLVHQLLIYPVTNYGFDTDSYATNGEGYFLTKQDMEWFWDHYLADEVDGKNPYASPLQARDLTGLPPATVVTSEYDPLRDEGAAYAARLADAGVHVQCRDYEGTIHGFVTMLSDPDLDVAREAITAFCNDLQRSFDRGLEAGATGGAGSARTPQKR